MQWNDVIMTKQLSVLLTFLHVVYLHLKKLFFLTSLHVAFLHLKQLFFLTSLHVAFFHLKLLYVYKSKNLKRL